MYATEYKKKMPMGTILDDAPILTSPAHLIIIQDIDVRFDRGSDATWQTLQVGLAGKGEWM